MTMSRETRMAFKKLVELGPILSTDVKDGKLYVVYTAPPYGISRCDVFEGEEFVEANEVLKAFGFIS